MFDDLRERATEYYEEPEPEPTNVLADLIDGFDPQERFILALLLFFNVVVIGCMCLAAFGRIQF
jgi:hypothetical protein